MIFQQIGDMVADGRVPHKMKLLLENPRIWKVGRLIEGDVKKLKKGCPSSRINYQGIHDLAVLAKEQCVYCGIKNISLADLCARVLHKRLSKNVSERTSNWWSNPQLTTTQIRYAALDAYASRRIFEVLASLNAPQLGSQIDDQSTLQGAHVFLQAGDKRSYVAHGRVIHALDGRKALVRVSEVFKQAAKVPDERMSIGDYGAPPSSVPYPLSHILVYTPLPKPPISPDFDMEVDTDTGSSQPGTATPACSGENTSASLANTAPVDYPPGHEVDAGSAAFGQRMLGTRPTLSWSKIKRSRIIKDVFHAMHMFNIPQRHGLRREFARALRNAFYIFDAADVERIARFAATLNPPQTFLQMYEKNPQWVLRRCKRQIPPPEILYP